MGGSSSTRWRGVDSYDGGYLASRGLVVVTINYRLGPLGYLAHPGLTRESRHASSGNYGPLDQIAALKWVRRNIAAFGGDPGRVTLFGHSAGATDALVLIASPLARGLFTRAILLSGNVTATPLARAEADGERLAAALGCAGRRDTVACLRSCSAAELITAQSEPVVHGVRYHPNVDGWVLPAPALAHIAAGRHNAVPVIIGTTSNEMSTLVQHFVDRPIVDIDGYHAALHRILEPELARVAVALYPAAKYDSPHAALLAVLNDYGFAFPARLISRALCHGQRELVWRMVFDFAHWTGPSQHLGSGHGMELPFIFHNVPSWGVERFDREARSIADLTVGYWLAFAASGRPDADPDLPAWPPYDLVEERHLEIGRRVDTGARHRADACDAWGRATSRLPSRQTRSSRRAQRGRP